MYDVGDTYPATVKVKDSAGAPVNPATVTLTITLPDDSTVSPSITNPPAETGTFIHNFVITQAGRHVFAWTSTTPATAYTDVLNARSAAGGIVGLVETKEHLNLDLALTTHDEELRRHIGATTRVIEGLAGAVVKASYEEVVPSGAEIVLGHRPVLSLTSFTPVHAGGEVLFVADMDLDKETGIVRRKDGGRFNGYQRVVYRAGRAVVPENILLATWVILAHLWTTQRGGGSTNVDQEETVYLTMFGFAVPRRALELLGSDLASGIS